MIGRPDNVQVIGRHEQQVIGRPDNVQTIGRHEQQVIGRPGNVQLIGRPQDVYILQRESLHQHPHEAAGRLGQADRRTDVISGDTVAADLTVQGRLSI